MHADQVTDWATDFDIFDPAFLEDPFPVFAELRARHPVARTDRWGGQWLPVRYADVAAVAGDPEHFSSVSVAVVGRKPGEGLNLLDAPPITTDPPFHGEFRRLLLPAFAPRVIERLTGWTAEVAQQLVADIDASGDTTVDAAERYARHLPVRVIAAMLGVPAEEEDQFTDWTVRILRTDPTDLSDSTAATKELLAYFRAHVQARRDDPGHHDDIITMLMNAELHDEPIQDRHVVSACFLMLIAGIDTTWSSIGAALAHFGAHAEDRRRLLADPALLPGAIEELLRFYAPVTQARIAVEGASLGGHTIPAGDRVLLPLPAANRDPEVFDDPETFRLDRAENRHLSFGVGIHRCLGSNLARMELRVALETWLAAFPDYSLVPGEPLEWTGGNIRGPRRVVVRLR